MYHTFPPQGHAQIRRAEAPNRRRRPPPEPYMEAHQLFATLFGAIFGFDQQKRRLRANRGVDLRCTDSNRASALGHTELIETAA